MTGLYYPPPEDNPLCLCRGNPLQAFWCTTGHMTECHAPFDCGTAACGHLERYDFDDETIQDLVAQAKARLSLPGSPYQVDELGNVTINMEAWTENGDWEQPDQSYDPGPEGTMKTDDTDYDPEIDKTDL